MRLRIGFMPGRVAHLMRLVLTATCVLALTGCDTTDKVLFVTNTSLGVNTDAAPLQFSVAYSRTEGVLGPTLPDGSMPSVYAFINADGGLLDRKVKQLYATGPASQIVLGAAIPPSCSTCVPLSPGDRRKLAFFGTDAGYGLKIAFSTLETGGVPVPSSMILGFKRKEISILPLSETSGGTVYPSTLAGIDSQSAAASNSATFGILQLFASGAAADRLAADSTIQGMFTAQARKSLAAQYDAARGTQDTARADILTCYGGLPARGKMAAWENADDLSLFGGSQVIGALRGYYDAGQKDTATQFDNMNKGTDLYASQLNKPGAMSPDFITALNAHQKHVCNKIQG